MLDELRPKELKYYNEIIVDRLKYKDAVTMEDFKNGEYGITRPEWLGMHFIRNGKYYILLKTGEVIESPEHVFDTDKEDWLLVSFSAEATILLDEYFTKSNIDLRVVVNKAQEKLLMNFLEENNIKLESLPSPLQMFFEEEAEYRIRLNYEDEISEAELDDLIEEHQEALAEAFFDNEYVIDGELLDTITKEVVEGEYI